MDISFERILLSAVWMHVAPKDRELAIQRIAELMNSSGLAVFTLRHGSVPHDRPMHSVSADELIKLAAAVDMTPVRVTDCGAQLQRSGVFWQTVVLCRS